MRHGRRETGTYGRLDAEPRSLRFNRWRNTTDTPGPELGSSRTPPAVDRTTAPRWTTYQTPRQEIIEAMPSELIPRRGAVEDAGVRHLVVAVGVIADTRRDPMGVGGGHLHGHQLGPRGIRSEQLVGGADIELVVGDQAVPPIALGIGRSASAGRRRPPGRTPNAGRTESVRIPRHSAAISAWNARVEALGRAEVCGSVPGAGARRWRRCGGGVATEREVAEPDVVVAARSWSWSHSHRNASHWSCPRRRTRRQDRRPGGPCRPGRRFAARSHDQGARRDRPVVAAREIAPTGCFQ